MNARTRRLAVALAALLAPACGGPSDASHDGALDGTPGHDGGARPDAPTPDTAGMDVQPGPDVAPGTDVQPGVDSPVVAPDTGPRVDSGPLDAGPPPAMTCALPIRDASTAGAMVVGTGTAASCTAAALVTAVAHGGAVTFNCGGAATIRVTSELLPPADHDTVIDGGGTVTLDGGGTTRILHFHSGDYRGMYGGPQHVLTVQHIAFTNGHASGTAIVVPPGAPAACSRGTGTDGGGGAILMENGVLHVIDATFTNNHAAALGPDVGGGGVYASGSTDTTIVGSRFVGNSGSNGGAVGSLNTDLTIVNDTFTMSQALGTGANSVDGSMCPSSVNGAQIGSGGNGGAISIDGGSDGTVTVCGCTLSHGTAGAFGGAMFRTPDGAMRTMNIDQTTFDSNTAPVSGGGAMFIENSLLHVTNSTFSNNSAADGGAFQADGVTFQFTNVTLANNIALSSDGGAFFAFNSSMANTGTLTNCTVAGNQAHSTMMYYAFGGATFGTPFVWNNCLVVDNTDNDGNNKQACDHTGTGSHSLQWPATESTGAVPPCAAGITFANPMLGALGDHGGPTQTMAPAAAAGVVQIGTGCPATDQAGHARGTPCTAGALEAGH